MALATVETNQRVELGFAAFDADNHYYEAEDAVTRHLPKEHRSVVRWVEVDGRRLVLVGDRLLSIVPNPTYDPVGVPGSLEVYFRAQNHEGKEIRDIIEMAPIPPAARDRVARVAKLDEQGVDLAWVLPSLGLGLEEMLAKDVDALYAVFHSYNQWLDEDYTIGLEYHADGRPIGLCNAIYMCAPFSQFGWKVLSEFQAFDAGIHHYAEFAVYRPLQWANEMPGEVNIVKGPLLGPMHWDIAAYWEREEPLQNVVIAHLWRTGHSDPFLQKMTEQDLRHGRFAYAQAAKRYV